MAQPIDENTVGLVIAGIIAGTIFLTVTGIGMWVGVTTMVNNWEVESFKIICTQNHMQYRERLDSINNDVRTISVLHYCTWL